MKFKFSSCIVITYSLLLIFSACKKGDNDPVISLQSRKARLSGEWKLDGYEKNTRTVNTIYQGAFSWTETTLADEKYYNGTASIESNFSTSRDISTFTGISNQKTVESGELKQYTLTIKKDGSWSATKIISWKKQEQTTTTVFQTQSTSSTNVISLANTITFTSSGTWQFLGKNKGLDLKNKEAIALSISETKVVNENALSNPVTVTTQEFKYGPNENTEIWTISMLKSKEVQMERLIDNSNGPASQAIGTITNNTNYTSVSGTIKVVYKAQ